MDDEQPPSSGTRTPGRPRDATIDERVLAATRELLVEEGWEGTTIRGIATRAGVSRPAIARRWPSKAWLVMEAILGPAIEADLFADVDQGGWIQAVIDGSFALFRRPDVKAAVPGLLAALPESEELRASLFSSFTGPPIDLYSEISAERDPDARSVDARAFIVLAAGAALFSALIVGDEADERLVARVGELLDGLAAGVSAS